MNNINKYCSFCNKYLNIKYNNKEDFHYINEETALDILTEILCIIFNKTLSDKKIFNIRLLIRQNFLTICETEEILEYLFGCKDLLILEVDDDGEEIYHFLSYLEDKVVENVMKKLNLKDLDIEDLE